MGPKKRKPDSNLSHVKFPSEYLYDKQTYLPSHKFKAGKNCFKSSEVKYATGIPNTSNPKTVSSFDFVIENNNKHLTFLPNHLLVYAKVKVTAKPKADATDAKKTEFFLNYDDHKMTMVNGISQFIHDVDVSFNYSYPGKYSFCGFR